MCERGRHVGRCLHPEAFLTYLPGSPVKEPPHEAPSAELFGERCPIPRAPLFQVSKYLVDEPSSRFSKTGPLLKEMPISRACSTYPSGSPAGQPSLQVPLTELPERDTPPPELLSIMSQSLEWISPLQVAQLSPHEERCPSTEPSFHLGLGRSEHCSSLCHGNPHQGIPSTTVTASHVSHGRVEYKSMVP